MVNKIIDKQYIDLSNVLVNELNLSLLIGPDRFTYLVYSKKNSDILQLGFYTAQISVDNLEQLLSNITEVGIELNSLDSIDCAFHHFDIIKNRNFQSGSSADFRLFDYYNEAVHCKNYLAEQFPNVKFKDSQTLLLNAFNRTYSEKTAILSYWQSGKLFMWSLSFGLTEEKVEREFISSEDALYHVLHFYKSAGFNVQKDKFYIAGELSEDSTIFKRLFNYVANIEFVKNPSALKLNTDEELPEQLFFDILSLTL